MWGNAALLAVGLVLFINMGLSDAIQKLMGFRLGFLSCPKCLVFWATIAYLAIRGGRIIPAVGGSFLFSYLALWLDLGLSALNRKYNELYEQIFSAETDNGPGSTKKHGPSKAATGRSGMSTVRNKKVKEDGNSL